MRSALFILMFTFTGFSRTGLSDDSAETASKRVFCESDESALPYIKFDFYPYDRSDSDLEGNALISVDKGAVLDINTYNNVTLTISDETVTIAYKDGRLVFNIAGDFEHEGSIKHFLSGGILKEKVTCYYLTAGLDL